MNKLFLLFNTFYLKIKKSRKFYKITSKNEKYFLKTKNHFHKNSLFVIKIKFLRL